MNYISIYTLDRINDKCNDYANIEYEGRDEDDIGNLQMQYFHEDFTEHLEYLMDKENITALTLVQEMYNNKEIHNRLTDVLSRSVKEFCSNFILEHATAKQIDFDFIMQQVIETKETMKP